MNKNRDDLKLLFSAGIFLLALLTFIFEFAGK